MGGTFTNRGVKVVEWEAGNMFRVISLLYTFKIASIVGLGDRRLSAFSERLHRVSIHIQRS